MSNINTESQKKQLIIKLAQSTLLSRLDSIQDQYDVCKKAVISLESCMDEMQEKGQMEKISGTTAGKVS